jgi:hypothetical protein
METEIWKYDRGRYKVYIKDREVRKKLRAWKDCTLHCRYSHMSDMREIGWDFIFPGRIRDRVAELVGLPPQKDPRRVARGRELGGSAVMNDHLKIQSLGCIC